MPASTVIAARSIARCGWGTTTGKASSARPTGCIEKGSQENESRRASWIEKVKERLDPQALEARSGLREESKGGIRGCRLPRLRAKAHARSQEAVAAEGQERRGSALLAVHRAPDRGRAHPLR